MAFIELKNINKTFFPNTNREHHALKNLNLTINSGDFITIIGGNGAGKSTLFNAISGVFSLDSGSISIRGKDISRVFQNPLDNTAPRMTVAENMALALNRGAGRSLKFSKNKENILLFESLLKNLNLGLEQKINTEMGVLSGGQRQAIALLMATMKTPELILLDEHTAALDPKTQKKIMLLTEEKIKEKNLTALMITHNLQDALTYGNRMLLLHRGEIVRDFSEEEKNNLTVTELYKIMVDLDEKD